MSYSYADVQAYKVETEGVIKPYKNQDYYQLKQQYNQNRLFVDDLFPANNRSLYYSRPPPTGVKWLRPKIARKNPMFVVDGFNRADLDQGYLKNCWAVAAMSGLCQSPKLLAKVVPQDQDFNENYCGMFHFRFWIYGEWYDVVVDDRLPYDSSGRQLFCSDRNNPNEYWGCLLEKAYAKIYGNYENLDGGLTSEALVDMSGGVSEKMILKYLRRKELENLWFVLKKAFEMNSIIGCSILADPYVMEAKMSNGLVKGHAYTITKVVEIQGVKLIRMRNPWGYNEWKGPWSDGSPEWNSLSDSERLEQGYVIDSDGEFWMTYNDFMWNFELLEFLHLSADSFSEELLETDEQNYTWKTVTYQSEWKSGITAGGSNFNMGTKYWTNPQFLINVTHVDRINKKNKADVLVSLMQKNRREKRFTSGKDEDVAIHFKFFKVRDDIPVDDFKENYNKLYANQLIRMGDSGNATYEREITRRFKVDPGHYVIIPSTYMEDTDCEFMLRVFTEQPVDCIHLNGYKETLEFKEYFYSFQEKNLPISSINFRSSEPLSIENKFNYNIDDHLPETINDASEEADDDSSSNQNECPSDFIEEQVEEDNQ